MRMDEDAHVGVVGAGEVELGVGGRRICALEKAHFGADTAAGAQLVLDALCILGFFTRVSDCNRLQFDCRRSQCRRVENFSMRS